MAAFDDLGREFSSRTVRWTSPPTVYVDTEPMGFKPGPELDQWISEVRVQAVEFISEWSGAELAASSVRVTSSPLSDLTPGTIVIHFSEKDATYNYNSGTIALTRLSWTSDHAISGAAIWLRYERFSGSAYTAYRKAILGHEIGHVMGLGHMNGSTSSLMTPSISQAGLTSFDQQAGLFLYSRSPKNTSADIDNQASYLGALVPAGVPGR